MILTSILFLAAGIWFIGNVVNFYYPKSKSTYNQHCLSDKPLRGFAAKYPSFVFKRSPPEVFSAVNFRVPNYSLLDPIWPDGDTGLKKIVYQIASLRFNLVIIQAYLYSLYGIKSF